MQISMGLGDRGGSVAEHAASPRNRGGGGVGRRESEPRNGILFATSSCLSSHLASAPSAFMLGTSTKPSTFSITAQVATMVIA
jgi:hypothetical protein